ncbi:MAG: MarR family transcriptional regulator [Sulfuritalea sp.]|nr:MarR family transcriptional regulator [Sulfuritalea sp.]
MSSAFSNRVFDFSRDDPPRLLLEGEPEDLFRALKALPAWTARALEVADAALALWASNAHARHRDREGLAEIHLLIRRLQVLHPVENEPPELDVAAYYHRWNGMAALVENRAHLLDRHDPATVEQRTHMPALKRALADAAPRQSVRTQELLEHLGLSKPRLSQLLALAEAAGLIERRKEGREHWVSAAGIWCRSDDIAKSVAKAIPFVGAFNDSGMHVPGKAKLAA